MHRRNQVLDSGMITREPGKNALLSKRDKMSKEARERKVVILLFADETVK